MPDLVGNLRIDQAWGSAQVMAAAHQVNFSNAADPNDKTGWAVGAGLKFNLPMLGHGDNVAGQFTYAKGALDYVGSGMGNANTTIQGGTSSFAPGFDAVVTAAGQADLTTGWSITGGYEHHWNPNWKTSLYGAYGEVNYSTAASAALQAECSGRHYRWLVGRLELLASRFAHGVDACSQPRSERRSDVQQSRYSLRWHQHWRQRLGFGHLPGAAELLIG